MKINYEFSENAITAAKELKIVSDIINDVVNKTIPSYTSTDGNLYIFSIVRDIENNIIQVVGDHIGYQGCIELENDFISTVLDEDYCGHEMEWINSDTVEQLIIAGIDTCNIPYELFPADYWED